MRTATAVITALAATAFMNTPASADPPEDGYVKIVSRANGECVQAWPGPAFTGACDIAEARWYMFRSEGRYRFTFRARGDRDLYYLSSDSRGWVTASEYNQSGGHTWDVVTGRTGSLLVDESVNLLTKLPDGRRVGARPPEQSGPKDEQLWQLER